MEILHFKNLEQISTTDWGTVYCAYDPLLDRKVALKVIRNKSSIADFSQLLVEARAAAALDHPNICTVHQVHQMADDDLVMVLNWCSEGSLKTLLETGPIAGDRTHELAVGTVKGIAAIHEGGLLHRDIKPGNILIDHRFQPRLADFGLSVLLDDTDEELGIMAGTMPYMAPEILRGEAPSEATDLWSLGVLLFQMVTGRLPFTDIYEAALRYSIEYSDVPDISLEDSQAQRILQVSLLCMMKDPGQRPSSVASVLLELEKEPEKPEVNNTQSSILWRSISAIGGIVLVLIILFLTGSLPGLSPTENTEIKLPSGVTVLPFTSVGGDASDEVLARGLSKNTTDALLRLEPELENWWFVPSHRIHLREIDNLTRAYGLTGATYAITGRLEKPGDDIFKLSLRREYIGSGHQNSDQDYLVEMIVGRNDLATWQVEVPRRIVQLLEAPWPENGDSLLRPGSTSSAVAFNNYLLGQGLLAAVGDQSDTLETRSAFMRSIQADPNYALGWWGLGLSDEQRGGPSSRKASRQKWQRSLESSPDLMLPLVALVSSFHATEDDSLAKQYLDVLLETQSDDFQSQLVLGDVFAALGDSSAAHSAYSRAIGLHPGDAVGPNCLGAFLFNYYGNTEAAAVVFNQAAEEASHDPDTLLFLGACHFANDQMSKAQSAFERSLSLERNALALEYLAIIYFYQGSYGRGAALAEELLLQDDSRYEVWNLLGACQDQMPDQRHLVHNNYKKAAALCRAEIQRTNDRPSLWAMMGVIEAQLGNDDEAFLWLQRAVDRAPLRGDTMLNMAEGFEILGDRDAALYWLEKLFDTGYSSVVVERHPGFASLRADSRYREIQ